MALPDSWTPSDKHHDERVLHGFPLFSQIHPTAWSRKKGLHGVGPLKVPLAHLCRHGLEEFSLRPLSAGRFIGVVCTRTIAESVFTAQLLKSVREHSLDLDSICEHLHREQQPATPVPSKTDSPGEFMAPLIHQIIDKLKDIAPQKAETAAMRRAATLEKRLQDAEAKLAAAGLHSAPSPSPSPTPTPRTAEPSSARKRASLSELGASPKKAARKPKALAPNQPKLTFPTTKALALPAATPAESGELPEEISQFSDEEPPAPAPSRSPAEITPESVLSGSSPVLKNHPTVPGYSDATVKKWFASFASELRQPAQKIVELLQSHGVTKGQLQEAAVRYGLPFELATKMAPRNLQQVVSMAAALAA
eukprot:Skav233173  [mRNA]  locus=scaffold24:82815:83906:+ [translate_table: standard]